MFGLKYVRFKLVEFECSPVPEGKMFVAVGLFIAVLTVMGAIVNSGMPLFLPVTLGLVSVGCIGFGVYYWAFRYGPVKRQVVIGNWCHRLYLRNRWLFVAVNMAYSIVIYVIVSFVCTLIFYGFSDLQSAFAEQFKSCFILLFFLLMKSLHEYMAYREYYRSAKYRETLVEGENVKG